MKAKKRKLLKYELQFHQRILNLFERDSEMWIKFVGVNILAEAMMNVIRVRREIES